MRGFLAPESGEGWWFVASCGSGRRAPVRWSPRPARSMSGQFGGWPWQLLPFAAATYTNPLAASVGRQEWMPTYRRSGSTTFLRAHHRHSHPRRRARSHRPRRCSDCSAPRDRTGALARPHLQRGDGRERSAATPWGGGSSPRRAQRPSRFFAIAVPMLLLVLAGLEAIRPPTASIASFRAVL